MDSVQAMKSLHQVDIDIDIDMSTTELFPVRKTFLYLLIGSVLLSAFFGIAAILSGRFGWVEFRILLTTVTMSMASLCGLACGAYLGTTGRTLPLLGMALSSLAAAMIISGMWFVVDSIAFWKLAAASSVFAVACAHLSLLSMARLAQWFQWSLIAAYVIIFGVAALISGIILFEIQESAMFQLLAVAAIFDAAVTLIVPICHRLSRSDVASLSAGAQTNATDAIEAEIASLKLRIDALQEMKQATSELEQSPNDSSSPGRPPDGEFIPQG